jgi:hypothetical protein
MTVVIGPRLRGDDMGESFVISTRKKFPRQFRPISGTSGNADDFFSILK